jgi:glycosyltransferase involved in cell wall biosynthesis
MPNGAERSVLHVLPHPRGGGETYVDLLEAMPGYRFERMYLAPSPSPGVTELGRGLAAVARAARQHDLLHVHGEVAAGLCLALLATRPSVVTLHGLHLVRRLGGASHFAARLNLRAVLRAANRTICVSESEHDELVRAVGTRAARRSIVIRNGVPVPPPIDPAARANVRDALGIAADDVVAIWVGALDERKDPLMAARASEEANVILLVVGDGPLRATLEEADFRWMHVLGQRDDVSRLLAASDVFVLTSQREGLAFSLLEAMAHGLVPVVTDLAENREAIGDAGVAVRVDDEPLGSALRRLAANPGERAQLATLAVERVSKHFTASEMERRTHALYDDALGAGQHTSPRNGTP